MTEIKIKPISNEEKSVMWEINLYSRDIFIETICTCHEKEYVKDIACFLAEKLGSSFSNNDVDF